MEDFREDSTNSDQVGNANTELGETIVQVGRRSTCSWCNGLNYAASVNCRICGHTLRHTTARIRCSKCKKMQSTELLVCGSCGRELRPAPRRYPWLVPTLAAAIVAFILWQA